MFWDNIESPSPKGMKSEAQTRWIREGRPLADMLIMKWKEYINSIDDQSAMHVCRWLGLRGWEETYSAPVRKVPQAQKSWLERQNDAAIADAMERTK